MFYRRSPSARKQPAPAAPLPVPQQLLDEHAARPFLGSSGEWIAAGPPSPRTEQPAQRPFTIEAPPWKTDPVAAAAAAMSVDADPVLPVGALGAQALAELKAQDGEFDPPSPSALRGPPEKLEPLRRPAIPAWPAQERRAEQLARERAAQGIHEEKPARYPPPRRETL